jgi:phosphatidylglycerophosphate synthase
MKEKKNEFEEFKKKTLHPREELLAILAVNPITVRIAYLIKKFNLNISPNNVTSIRLFLLFPLTIFLLFLAPILQYKSFYLFSAICIYFMAFTDDLDGNLARGLDKKSNYGAFLDSIADRTYPFVLLTFIFSLGMWANKIFLIYGALLIFILKSFHLMVISKIFYYNPGKFDMETIFSAKKEIKYLGLEANNIVMVNLNKILKIKRWCENFGGFERIFLMVIVPSILFYFGFELTTLVIVYTITIVNLLFYASRIKNLLLAYHTFAVASKKK